MKMTLNLWDIVDRWKEIIVNSDEINDFCTKNYGKKPMIFLGADPKEPPEEENTPFILIMPGGKKEGADQDTNKYVLYLYCCISQNTKTDGEEKSSEVLYLPGEKQINDFADLIFSELQDNLQEHPISTYALDVLMGTTFPQFSAMLTLTTEIEPAMGEEIIY
nr:MAG TPA_asm: hypothetical protein [Caudoviricetes sp.]